MATIPRDSDFFRHSVKVAESFLNSAVVFDDSVGFMVSRPTKDETADLDIDQPEQAPIGVSSVGDEVPSADLEDPKRTENGAHYLYAKAVIDGFARKRIVCSVIKPEPDELGESEQIVQELARSADIVVLDWSMFKDNGETALRILSNTIQGEEGNSQGQLRLIAIYTGSPELYEIYDKIRSRISAELQADISDTDNLSFTFCSAKVVVLAKPETTNLAPGLHDYVVPFEGLVDRLTLEFAEMTAGLVSNSVLDGLATIRRNTHRILARFQGGLDGPYLAHRFMLADPGDAESYLTYLVAEELLGLLDETGIGHNANAERIKEWLDVIGLDELNLADGVTFTKSQILKTMEIGFGSVVRNRNELGINCSRKILDDIGNQLHQKNLSAHFALPGDSTTAEPFFDEHFSYLSTMRAHYEGYKPLLTLGTIIRREREDQPDNGEGTYYVCIQPRCDSVRVHKPRQFPFLPLTKDNGFFDLVVREGTMYQRLRCSRKPFDIVMVTFDGVETGGKILAQWNDDNGGYEFLDADKYRYRWVGELRGDHSLRLANQFSATMSRIGLEEYEWLRRYATRR